MCAVQDWKIDFGVWNTEKYKSFGTMCAVQDCKIDFGV